jgi:hypothetical protein
MWLPLGCGSCAIVHVHFEQHVAQMDHVIASPHLHDNQQTT